MNSIYIVIWLLFLILSYSYSGVTWFSVTLFAMVVVAIIVEAFAATRAILAGKAYTDFLAENVQAQANMWPRTLDDMIGEKIGYFNWLIVIALVFGLPILGEIVGWYQAKSQRVFLSVKMNGEVYVIVRAFQSGIVLSAIEESMDGRSRPTINGHVQWLSDSDLSSHQFLRKRYPLGIGSISEGPRRQTFGEWYEANWGHGSIDDGRAGR